MLQRVFVRSLFAAIVLFSVSTASASAANLLVDDDTVECPAAGFNSVQAAVDAATDGDTVVVCPGEYVEGSGNVGTSSVTINKEIDIKGAGADLSRFPDGTMGVDAWGESVNSVIAYEFIGGNRLRGDCSVKGLIRMIGVLDDQVANCFGG